MSHRIYMQAILFIMFFVQCSLQGFAQGQGTQGVLAYAHNKYGANELLYTGKRYLPRHYRASGHPFFSAGGPLPARIHIQDYEFRGISVQYDLEQDQMLLPATDSLGNHKRLILSERHVDTLYIEGKRFVPVSKCKAARTKIHARYADLLHDGHFRFLVVYKKFYKANSSSMENQYGSFSDTKKQRYILYKGETYRVRRRRHFLRTFPGHKPALRQFMRDNGIAYNQATRDELQHLTRFCNALLLD